MRQRVSRRGDEGAVLVIALVFLVVGMVIIGGLTYAVGNNLNNSSNFKVGRSVQYAASSAVNQAIQSIRYSPMLATGQTLNASPPTPCWTPTSGTISDLTNIDGVAQVDVWCSTIWTPTSATTRVVTLSACTDAANVPNAAACAASPTLQAVVTFNDYPPGLSSPTTVECDVYCGTGMKVNSWTWAPTVPTVSAISVGSGPVTGGTTTNITGTGFVTGSSVSLVEESGGVPTSDNVVLSGTNVIVNNSSSITVTTPSMTAGRSYFVTVTSATGTSAYSSNAVFTFTPTLPTVTSLSTSTGYSAGGSSLTITGTGFTSGLVVDLFKESGGVASAPSVVVPVVNPTVNSDTSITIITPSVITATTYFVAVITPGGTSAFTSASVFTYQPLVPTAASISPTSGPANGGTTITITGTGFVTGATVAFVKENNGYVSFPTTSVAGTSVTVVSSSTITVVTPNLGTYQTYYVTVTTPTGTSNYYPVFTS